VYLFRNRINKNMLNDKDLIFEQYKFSKRRQHNLISENKCCETCGVFLSESEIQMALELDEMDIFTEAAGKPNGYVIYEGTNVHGRYACIATGLVKPSANVKTGPMIQIFIINADVHPVEAVRQGKNLVQCYNCIHRPATDEEREKGIEGGSCYVDVGKSVAMVYKTYKKGCYPNICGDNKPEFGDSSSYLKLGADKIEEIFGGRKVRFGAYGEPINIPYPMIDMIAGVSSGHTGYTHQWKNPALAAYNKYLQASVDSPAEYKMAKAKGWRTFRVSTDWDLHEGEMICMNSWQDKTCAECLLCGGNTTKIKQDIIIKVHGKLKHKFKPSAEAIASMGHEGDPTQKYNPEDDVNPEMTERLMSLSPAQKKQVQKADEQEAREKQEKADNRSLKSFIQATDKYKSEFYPNKPKKVDKNIRKQAKSILRTVRKNPEV
jgi:hypothetical protein